MTLCQLGSQPQELREWHWLSPTVVPLLDPLYWHKYQYAPAEMVALLSRTCRQMQHNTDVKIKLINFNNLGSNGLLPTFQQVSPISNKQRKKEEILLSITISHFFFRREMLGKGC
jgi:hypothetical protein